MATANKVITTQSQARLSKLKNKKSQLENLLRSRERLDYEIKNLKKSIQKDQKNIVKEITIVQELARTEASDSVILEQIALDEGGNPQESFRKIVKILEESQDELIMILRLLLKFAEAL